MVTYIHLSIGDEADQLSAETCEHCLIFPGEESNEYERVETLGLISLLRHQKSFLGDLFCLWELTACM